MPMSYQGMWFRLINKDFGLQTDRSLVYNWSPGDIVVGLDCYGNPISPEEEIKKLIDEEINNHQKYINTLQKILTEKRWSRTTLYEE